MDMTAWLMATLPLVVLLTICGGFGGVFFLEHERNGASRGRPGGPCGILMALHAGGGVFGVADVVAAIATAQDVDEPSQDAPRLPFDSRPT